MSQKVYADEATLTAHLDKLLSTATPTYSPSLYTDTTITVGQLLTGHTVSNEQLSKIGISQLPPLPPPNVTKPVDEILAAAFTAIIRLSQCAQANKNLRESAEASLRNSTKRVEELTNRLSTTEERIKKQDGQINTMRNTFNETVSKHRLELRKLSAECNQFRTRLLHASHRENQFILTAKKKEKEFGQLQSRVHALFKTSVNIDQRITRVGTRTSPRSEESLHADLQDVGQDRVDVVESENDVMRGLLQAVQEELDDLILSHGESASEVSQEFDVPPAPRDDVMGLPLEVIQDDLQDCLEKKFGILRKVLERGGQFDESESRDSEGREESVDVEPTGRTGDVVCTDSAYRSDRLISGIAHSVDAQAREADEDTELVDAHVTDAEQPEAKDEHRETEVVSTKAGSEPTVVDAELIKGDVAGAAQLEAKDELVNRKFVPREISSEKIETNVELVKADATDTYQLEAKDKQADTEAAPIEAGSEPTAIDAERIDADSAYPEAFDMETEWLNDDAAQVETRSDLADADNQPINVDMQSINAGTTPLDIEAATNTGSLHRSLEPGGNSSDAVDGDHKSLKDALKTLSITETDKYVTESTSPTTSNH